MLALRIAATFFLLIVVLVLLGVSEQIDPDGETFKLIGGALILGLLISLFVSIWTLG